MTRLVSCLTLSGVESVKARTNSTLSSKKTLQTRQPHASQCPYYTSHQVYSVENIPKLLTVACTCCNFIMPIGTVFLFMKRPQLTPLYHPLTSVNLKPCMFKSSSSGAAFGQWRLQGEERGLRKGGWPPIFGLPPLVPHLS